MYLHGEVPLPNEYEFMALDGLVRGPAPPMEGRVLVAVDCANESRLGPDPDAIIGTAELVVNIDHHHDNSLFGGINLIVAEASSTGEILRDVIREVGVALTPAIAEALYIAIVTDTGRFQYSNTTAHSLRLAAELVDAGADVHRVFQGVYESVAFAKLKLVARALETRAALRGRPRRRLAPRARGLPGDRCRGAVLGGRHRLPARRRGRRAGGARSGGRRTSSARTGGSACGRPRRISTSRRSRARAAAAAIARRRASPSDATVEEITDFIRREYLAQVAANRA